MFFSQMAVPDFNFNFLKFIFQLVFECITSDDDNQFGCFFFQLVFYWLALTFLTNKKDALLSLIS